MFLCIVSRSAILPNNSSTSTLFFHSYIYSLMKIFYILLRLDICACIQRKLSVLSYRFYLSIELMTKMCCYQLRTLFDLYWITFNIYMCVRIVYVYVCVFMYLRRWVDINTKRYDENILVELWSVNKIYLNL